MYLDLSFKNLTTLHEFDLTRVTQLYCGYNQLTSLPPLPETLKELYCDFNQLISLPPLPETLEILDCTNNQLTSLPPLLETLAILYCYNNQLTSLPPLPETLEILYCYDNRLTSLPPLPWGLKNMEKGKLDQHNKKRIDLQMEKVKDIPDKETWDDINERHMDWQYRIGGQMYQEAVSSLK